MNRFTLSLAIAAALAVAGCVSKEPSPPPAGKTSLGTATAGDLTVELLTDDRLETGMMPVYVKVTDGAGQPVTDATVSFMPLMTMTMPPMNVGDPPTTKQHGAPVIGPPALDADGLYRCDVVFQMASYDRGSDDNGIWSATVDVTPAASAMVSASFPALTVTDSGRAKVFTHAATSTKYVMSLNFTAAPAVGVNPILVTLHRMQDMMTFPSVDDATIHLVYDMPEMTHAASDAYPTLASPPRGVYEGQLGFSMAGMWEAKATISSGGVEITDPVSPPTFTIDF